MINRTLMIALSLAFLTVPGCSGGKSTETLVLDDFESEASLTRWTGPVSISAEHPAHGGSCAKIDLSSRRARTVQTEDIPHDWSAYKLLKFDIYNPTGTIQSGLIQIFDELATDEEASWGGQSYRGRKIFMMKGWNHYEFILAKANVEEGNRSLALDKIRRFLLDFGRVSGGVLYLDNMRLVAGEETGETASSVDPRDCRVVIDDRYVDPSLYGPEEKIEPDPAILNLRSQAKEIAARLKDRVKAAGARGYQTLYWRILLETARIGLEVRSELVWFQNEEQERNILEYVIASCTQAADEIDRALESSGSEQTSLLEKLYVPPLPKLKGLKQSEGFYRYENGAPVIFLAMHSINRGALLDYFAPYDHVRETYTVGGGSRGDIENSPVYEAFHKYPDTHRVGWDGWCGHLIKDRWSMGGKKESVVICLESPHIRQAVLEYMKGRCERWKKMPNLMYNIMAYELMYICYCDRSQQMFRDWLKSKYGSIGKLNSIWETSYGDFAELTAPPAKNAAPEPDVNRAAWYDWACFNTRRFTDYLKWVKSEIRKLDPDTPINAGGTSSMLSSANSTTGIDEEMIINEVDDVILNESGGSHIFSDLFLSLSREKKAMVEPEMGGGVHGLLLHFLHGKSTIAKWLWREQNSREFPMFATSSVPISWNIPLSGVAEVLKVALDVRRLNREIEEFTRPEPEVAIFYSKSSIVQVPPHLHRAGRTPYLDAVFSTWEGSRFLGCRVGFVSEKQILSGKLSRVKLLIVPAVKYSRPEVTDRILKYVESGGTAVVVAESFLFDQYARQNDRLAQSGLKITDVTLPPVLGEGEVVQNYDQSITQTIIYGDVKQDIVTGDRDIFRNNRADLRSNGLIQTIEAGRNEVLARFTDSRPAIVLVRKGRGYMYYLAAPLETADYHKLLAPLADRVRLTRPLVGVNTNGELVTGAEVRAVQRVSDYLIYASNLGQTPVEFTIRGKSGIGAVQDLRSLKTVDGGHVKLAPWQETIFRVEKKSR